MPTEKSQSAGKGASSSVAASPTDGASLTARDTDKARGDVSAGADYSNHPQADATAAPAAGGAAVVLLAVLLVFGIPWIRQTLNTVSTDDAFVNGHVTFVAARVPGQVSRVLVDDNNRVQQGRSSRSNSTRNPMRRQSPSRKRPSTSPRPIWWWPKLLFAASRPGRRSQYWALQNAIEDVDNQDRAPSCESCCAG